MKVSGKNPPVHLEAYLNQIRQQQLSMNQQRETAQAASSDKVELSERAREVQLAAQALKAMPEIREEKVQQVRLQVEEGTYKVSGSRIATEMLRESFENNTILNKIDTRA